MSDVVIRAEGLGKAYQIRHEAERRHDRFSEMLAERARRLFRRGGEADPTRETFWALRDVSFEVREGEVVGIIGRNGAGKSTLLKVLSRITEPTEGRVELRGRVASLLEVGTGFHPELTGRENVFLNGAILGMSRAEIRRKFDEIVDFAGVEKFLDTPVKRYSSGMRVRLAFAVAAHLEPEILVVDEVLAVGDAEFQRKCLGKMGEVAKGGRTVLFVSHNMGAIMSLCQRCMLIDGGQVLWQGVTDFAIEKYLNHWRSRGRETSELAGAPRQKRVVIENIEFVPPTSGSLQWPTTLAPCTVRISVNSDHFFGNAEIAFFLQDAFGRPIHRCSTRYDLTEKLDIFPGNNEFDLVFPSLLLIEGEYIIGAGVASAETGWIYKKEFFTSIQVCGSPKLDGRSSQTQSLYPIIIPHGWVVCRNEDSQKEAKDRKIGISN